MVTLGYYASGSSTFTFKSEESLIAAAAAIENDEPEDGIVRTLAQAQKVIADALFEVGEESDYSFDENTPLEVSGWSGGKFYDSGWQDFLAAVAPHATGGGDWMGEEDCPWRDVVKGDGEVHNYNGIIVYPDDPEDDTLANYAEGPSSRLHQRLAELQKTVRAARAAALGDSNDAEIEALQDALEEALALVPGWKDEPEPEDGDE